MGTLERLCRNAVCVEMLEHLSLLECVHCTNVNIDTEPSDRAWRLRELFCGRAGGEEWGRYPARGGGRLVHTTACRAAPAAPHRPLICCVLTALIGLSRRRDGVTASRADMGSGLNRTDPGQHGQPLRARGTARHGTARHGMARHGTAELYANHRRMTHRSMALKHGLPGSDCVLVRLDMSRSGTAQQSPQLLTAQQNTARRTPQVRPDQHKTARGSAGPRRSPGHSGFVTVSTTYSTAGHGGGGGSWIMAGHGAGHVTEHVLAGQNNTCWQWPQSRGSVGLGNRPRPGHPS